MVAVFRRVMDAIFWACITISGVSLVLISAVVPWGVYTRYVLNSAASWPEPAAILLTIVLTFFGAAACYRARLQMRLTVVTSRMPGPLRRVADWVSEGLVGLTGLFMGWYGYLLVETTWHQSIAEFPALSVGVTYLPIPIGGVLLLLFVIERLAIGSPPDNEAAIPGQH